MSGIISEEYREMRERLSEIGASSRDFCERITKVMALSNEAAAQAALRIDAALTAAKIGATSPAGLSFDPMSDEEVIAIDFGAHGRVTIPSRTPALQATWTRAYTNAVETATYVDLGRDKPALILLPEAARGVETTILDGGR